MTIKKQVSLYLSLEKKIKKYQVEAGDNNDRAQEIVTKSLDDLYKIYETTAKLFAKINNFKITVEACNLLVIFSLI